MAADIQHALAATSPWEIAAVLLAIAYLVLAVRESAWCWPAGIASSLIYLVLLFEARLYMESGLQVFYVAIGAWGWREWLRSGPGGGALPISRWPLRRQGAALLGVLAGSAITGTLLARYTPAALPWFDSFTTWGAVLATWMTARKFIENWLWWFVVDGVSAGLYVARGLYLTALLFGLYLVLIVLGWREWRQRLEAAGGPRPGTSSP